MFCYISSPAIVKSKKIRQGLAFGRMYNLLCREKVVPTIKENLVLCLKDNLDTSKR